METLLVASDIMTRQVITLPPEAGVLDGIRTLVKNRITGAPVLGRRSEYLGVFSEKCAMDGIDQAVPAESGRRLRARDVMQSEPLTLSPETSAVEAIGLLLSRGISGAPVVDSSGAFLGVFSEKSSMSFILGAAYDGLPDADTAAFMNQDPGRILESADVDLSSLVRIFLDTPYRRLLVLRDGRVDGLIGRRDVLRGALRLVEAEAAAEEALSAEGGRSVGAAMDCFAPTIAGNMDILRIATIFQNGPYRRLPVVEGERLLGLVSRRDVLAAARGMLAQPSKRRTAQLLYLSAVTEVPPSSVEA